MLADLRPRAATEIVDVSVQLFRRHARPLLVIAALVAIPQWLLGLATSTIAPDVDAAASPADVAGSITGLFGFSFIMLAWISVGFGALVHAASGAYLEDVVERPQPAFKAAFRGAWRLIMANLLGYLRAAIAAMLVLMVLTVPLAIGAELIVRVGPVVSFLAVLILIGLTLWVFCAELGRVMLVTPLVLLESRGILDSLRRSRRLTKGFVTRVAILIFVSMVISLAITGGVLVLSEAFLASPVIANVIGSVLLLPFYPLVACLVVVLYYDLRIRKEGLDLEMLAESSSMTAA